MAKLATSTRFFAPEISKVFFATSLANYKTGASRAEITASTDITDEIADLSGWDITAGSIDTPDLGTRFMSKIAGRLQTSDSSLTMYASEDGDDARDVLPRGTKGFIIFMDGGDVPTQPSDIFPIEVNSLGKVRTTGETAAQLTVGFTITAPPAEDVAIPAAA